MDQVQVNAELAEAQSSVVVSASPAVGGQLLAVPDGSYDVTVQIPQLPIRAKWRVGTSGDWNEFEGGEGFTVSGDDSARVYLAKFAEQSASVTAAVKVRTVGSFTMGSSQVVVVTAATNHLTGRLKYSAGADDITPTVGKSLRKRVVAKSIATFFNAGTANGAPGWTSHMIMAAPSRFTHIRVILPNLEASALSGVTASVAVTDSATSKINPSTGVWSNATFSGAGSVTLPARVSAQEPSLTLSDWIAIPSVDRVDGGSGKPLVMIRVFIPSANATFGVTGGLNPGGFNFTETWQTRQQVDGITTPANFTSTTEGSSVAIGGLMLRCEEKQVVVMGVGDSITSGFAGTVLGNNWGAQACKAANLVWVNAGHNGQTTANYLARGKSFVTALTPSIAIFEGLSVNDGTPTQNIVNAAWAACLEFVDHCEASGVIPVLWTAIPRNTYDATADGFRKAYNAKVRASGIDYIDFDSVMSDGATPAKIVTGLFADDRHPNDAGYVAMGTLAGTFLKSIAARLI